MNDEAWDAYQRGYASGAKQVRDMVLTYIAHLAEDEPSDRSPEFGEIKGLEFAARLAQDLVNVVEEKW